MCEERQTDSSCRFGQQEVLRYNNKTNLLKEFFKCGSLHAKIGLIPLKVYF